MGLVDVTEINEPADMLMTVWLTHSGEGMQARGRLENHCKKVRWVLVYERELSHESRIHVRVQSNIFAN